MLSQFRISIFCSTQFFGLKQWPAGRQIQIEWRFECKGARSARDGVRSVKQGHSGDQNPPIDRPIGMNHCRNVVRPFQFDLKAWDERLPHQRQITRIGRVNMLHQKLTIIDRRGKGDHSGCKNIGRPKPTHIDDAKSADHIRDKSADLLKITDVITRKFTIQFDQFSRTQRSITVVQLFWIQEFASGCGSQLKTPWRIDPMKLL